MKIEDQLCSREQAKKLFELGVKQNSYFVYGETVDNPLESWMIDGDEDTFYSAFTVAELGAMLPSGYDTMHSTDEGWRCYDYDGEYVIEGRAFINESEARAAAIIHLLKNNIISVDEVNECLLNS